MPIFRLSFLDLSPEQRKTGAKPVKERLRASLSNPDLTPDQIGQLQKQLQKIDQWEKGVLKRPPVVGAAPTETKVSPQFIQKLKSLGAPKN